MEGKDWLDMVDFKDEAAFYGEAGDSPPPLKDSERKRKHNKSEAQSF